MYEVKGSFRLGEKYEKFSIKVSAVNEKNAVDKVCARIGSNHKCKRRHIKVESVTLVKE